MKLKLVVKSLLLIILFLFIYEVIVSNIVNKTFKLDISLRSIAYGYILKYNQNKLDDNKLVWMECRSRYSYHMKLCIQHQAKLNKRILLSLKLDPNNTNAIDDYIYVNNYTMRIDHLESRLLELMNQSDNNINYYYYYRLGDIYYTERDYNKALRYYEKSINKIDDNNNRIKDKLHYKVDVLCKIQTQIQGNNIQHDACRLLKRL